MKSLNFAALLALVPLALALTSCERIEGLFKPKPQKPGPYAFDLVLRMSPRAEVALKRPGSGLMVDASYYGDAAPAYRGQADSLNRLYLGEERWTYSASARRIHLHGEPIDTAMLSRTRDGQPQTLVSVVGANSSPNDLLSCHNYIGPIRLAQQQTPVLDCQFDSEDYWDNAGAETSPQAGPARDPGPVAVAGKATTATIKQK